MKRLRFGRWELRADRYNWILIRHYSGKSKKTGEPVPKTEETYHRDLPQVARWIVDWEAKCAVDDPESPEGFEGSDDLKSLIAAVREREAHLAGILESLKEGGVL